MSIVRAFALSLPVAIFAASSSLPALAAEEGVQKPTIVVTAEGRATMAPDTALLDFSVVKNDKTAKAALDENNKAMAAVIDGLKKAGVADKDLQTSGFSVQPQYVYPQNQNNENKPPQLVGYQVSNSVSVRLRDLSKLGGVLDQAVMLGINQGGQIQFINDNTDSAMEEARRKAVANAMQKAKVLADAAQVILGKPIEIREQNSIAMPPAPAPMMRATMMKEADAGVPVQNGENTYNVNVQMVFAIQD
ncbi:SIMPL domain-containing protein [Oryzifoliimicrobium ureilyticus]|uniref:SIMPL domain-containing protein n=1 Tax=Oryzifoliimicrobium ureilyticus TaxID=3113724 RepID=UPI0030761E9B